MSAKEKNQSETSDAIIDAAARLISTLSKQNNIPPEEIIRIMNQNDEMRREIRKQFMKLVAKLLPAELSEEAKEQLKNVKDLSQEWKLLALLQKETKEKGGGLPT